MLPKDITVLLLKYSDSISEEISAINLAIERIEDALSTVNHIIINELLIYAKKSSTDNISRESELLSDSQTLREYINSLSKIQTKQRIAKEEKVNTDLNIHSVIVLSNTKHCSFSNHKNTDVIVQVPIIEKDGNINYSQVLASYCSTCKKYTILKDDFKNISGVILCEVIDESVTYEAQNNKNELDIKERESILYKYGYNVQSKQNLSSKQRHLILSSVIEANILTRRQIIDHLSTLIERGSKIISWKDATDKWKQDKYYVSSYKKENLPSIITNKIVLKYSNQE